jgi:hypothetical protein
MANDRNSFQKRQRELDKKRKAQDKRKRRQAQKNMPKNGDAAVVSDKEAFEGDSIE